MKFGQIRKPLLIFCLTASIFLHVGAVWFIYFHSFYFESSESTAMGSNPQLGLKDNVEMFVEKMEKALEESLNTAIVMSQKKETESLAQVKPLEEGKTDNENLSQPKIFASHPKVRKEELTPVESPKREYATCMPPPFDPERESMLTDFALDDELENDPITYESEKVASIDFSTHPLQTALTPEVKIIEDDYTMTDQQFSPQAYPTHSQDHLNLNFVASLQILKTSEKKESGKEKLFTNLQESSIPRLILPNAVEYLRNQWMLQNLNEEQLPSLDYYGLEKIASNLQWDEEIDVDVSVMAAPEGQKYVFSLTIHPDFEGSCPAMRQNFYFLIDRSSSIEKLKFTRFKKAVQRALAALHEGDNFNIYLFDKKITKLSDKTLAVTPKTIQMAEEFLDIQNSKTHFAATELYTTLEKMLPDHFNPDELHSVILITDGNTLLSPQKQKDALTAWIKKYEGLVNFYTAASGKGNNLVLLDLVSYSTAGKILYSDTNAGFPRQLVRLVRDLHNPMIKNITIDVSPSDPNAHVTLYPRSQLMPPMFAKQPFVIVGTVDEICDLTLFIQGRNHDKWLNFRKKVSLAQKNQITRPLEKIWAHTQSKICYDHFLKNGKNSHLKEAVEIVAPYRGVIAAEQ